MRDNPKTLETSVKKLYYTSFPCRYRSGVYIYNCEETDVIFFILVLVLV